MFDALQRRRRLTLFAVFAVCAGFAACSHRSAAEEDDRASPSAVPEVTLVRVARADVTRSLLVTGNVAALPNQDVRVSLLVPGRIVELRVAEGDHVRAGEILARLDDRPYRDQLRQAEALQAQARANLENARLARARNENLVQRGIAARKDLEDARTQESVAEAALQNAQAADSLARLQLSRTEAHAPFDGAVVKRFVSLGEQVDGTAGQPVVEVAQLAEVELLANVPAPSLALLRAGETFPVSSDAIPGQIFQGRVVAVSQAVDPASNAGLVRVRIRNPRGLLRLGMFLSARITVETHRGVPTVPPQAVYLDQQGRAHVYRVEGDLATAVPVQVGIETPERVELLSGAQPGDTVVLTGGYGLGEKARIRAQGASAP